MAIWRGRIWAGSMVSFLIPEGRMVEYLYVGERIVGVAHPIEISCRDAGDQIECEITQGLFLIK